MTMKFLERPEFKATQKLVGLFSKPPLTKFKLYSYFEHFDYLWSMDEEFLKQLRDERSVLVIVWDAVPTDPRFNGIPIEGYLTPIDWALAASAKSLAMAKRDVPGEIANSIGWKALIVDTSGGTNQSEARLRVLGHLQTGPNRLFTWFVVASANTAIESLLSLLLDTTVLDSVLEFNAIKGLWTHGLNNPGSESIRHSISNIVAPQVLLASTGVSSSSVHSSIASSLRVLLEACGLLPDFDQMARGPWLARAKWESGAIRQFILLDDMEDLGWSDFLRGALDLREGELQSYGQNDVERFLNEQPFAHDGTVLFLDLRLFARSEWSDEASFLMALAGYAKKQCSDNPSGSRPSFEDYEIAGVQRCAARKIKIEDSDYHIALTFLPRIISHVEPRLPIILFSSTGRKEIVERLRPYGNIVVEFEKPRFFGDLSTSILMETQRRFLRALQNAARIAVGRHKCSLLTQRLPTVGRSSSTPAVVEIYFDESGTAKDERFAVGGFAIAFNNDSDVNILDQLLSSRGLVWGIAQGFPPANRNASLPDRYFPKRAEGARPCEYYEEQLNALDKCFKEVGARIAAFCLVQHKPLFEAHALSRVTDELELDNRYRVMLAEALEMVLFDLLPTIGSPRELRIDIATKEGALTAKDKYSRDELITKYGMEFGDGKRHLTYRTTRTKDIFPLVAAVLSKRPVAAQHLPIRRARGITLVNYVDKDKVFAAVMNRTHLQGTQLHYMADWIAHFVFRPETMPPIAKRWLANGFIESRNSRLSSLLGSRRIADSGDSVSSLLELFGTTAADPSDSSPYLELLLPYIIDQVRTLSPAEFWRLCMLLPNTR